MTSDIQERLRADDLLQQDEEFVLIPLCREAADTIDSLLKRIEVLEADRDNLRHVLQVARPYISDKAGFGIISAIDAALSDGIVKG